MGTQYALTSVVLKIMWRQAWNNLGYRLTLKKRRSENPLEVQLLGLYTSSAGKHGFVWSLVRELGSHTHTQNTKKLRRRSILLTLDIFKLKEILNEKNQFPKMSEVRLLVYTKFSFKDVPQWKTFGSLFKFSFKNLQMALELKISKGNYCLQNKKCNLTK